MTAAPLPLEVACVLRSGGDFDPAWVLALYRGVRKYLPGARFTCLTDTPMHILGVRTIPMRHDWPRWWPKVELFRPDAFPGSRVLYLDLDTLPVGDLSEIAAYRGPFAVLSDFYTPQVMASGVMAWTPTARTASIYEKFQAQPQAIMRAHPGRSDLWYRKVLPNPARLQDLFPGQIVSLKAHAKHSTPAGARLVCGHGKPRFSHPSAGWANELWRARCM